MMSWLGTWSSCACASFVQSRSHAVLYGKIYKKKTPLSFGTLHLKLKELLVYSIVPCRWMSGLVVHIHIFPVQTKLGSIRA